MGWVQLVQSSDSGHPDRFELDPLALLRNANTPYAFFGIKPQLFDAPPKGLSPRADVAGTVIPRRDLRRRHQRRGVASWADHVGLLESEHPGWRFTPGQQVSKPGEIDRPRPRLRIPPSS